MAVEVLEQFAVVVAVAVEYMVEVGLFVVQLSVVELFAGLL
jgi:hypothetical protein